MRIRYAGYGPDSQMFVYRDTGEPFVCCFCAARSGRSLRTETGAEMADHVAAHVAVGLRVPVGLADRLRAADKEAR